MVKLKIREKSWTQNLKHLKQHFYEGNWEEIQEKFEKIQRLFEGGVAFWGFGSHSAPF